MHICASASTAVTWAVNDVRGNMRGEDASPRVNKYMARHGRYGHSMWEQHSEPPSTTTNATKAYQKGTPGGGEWGTFDYHTGQRNLPTLTCAVTCLPYSNNSYLSSKSGAGWTVDARARARLAKSSIISNMACSLVVIRNIEVHNAGEYDSTRRPKYYNN